MKLIPVGQPVRGHGLLPDMQTKANSMNEISRHASSTRDSVSRRQFLKHSTLAVSGAVAASGLPFAITAHAAPNDPIKVGVIGCGGRGS